MFCCLAYMCKTRFKVRCAAIHSGHQFPPRATSHRGLHLTAGYISPLVARSGDLDHIATATDFESLLLLLLSGWYPIVVIAVG
jgi:hypothetical protein